MGGWVQWCSGGHVGWKSSRLPLAQTSLSLRPSLQGLAAPGTQKVHFWNLNTNTRAVWITEGGRMWVAPGEGGRAALSAVHGMAQRHSMLPLCFNRLPGFQPCSTPTQPYARLVGLGVCQHKLRMLSRQAEKLVALAPMPGLRERRLWEGAGRAGWGGGGARRHRAPRPPCT